MESSASQTDDSGKAILKARYPMMTARLASLSRLMIHIMNHHTWPITKKKSKGKMVMFDLNVAVKVLVQQRMDSMDFDGDTHVNEATEALMELHDALLPFGRLKAEDVEWIKTSCNRIISSME